MNSSQQQCNAALSQSSIGYKIGLLGVVLTLVWIGVFKFTPTEAAAIEPLVSNHPFLGWLYLFMSVQTVSNLIGISELIIAAGLVYGFLNPKVGYYAGIAASLVFIMTLSFLVTTPNTWKVVDGMLTTSFFLLKDIVFLGIAIMTVEFNKARMNEGSSSASID